MTNAERRHRRSEAGKRAAETRRQLAATPPQPPRVETPEEQLARQQATRVKRLINLRRLIALAQEARREEDLYHQAHVKRHGHSPAHWSAEAIDDLTRFIEGFRTPDGRWQPDPITRNGKWRV